MDERDLAARLIGYDTSRAAGITKASGFIKGWLEARDMPVREFEQDDLPVLAVTVGKGSADAPTIVLHGHIDIVPGFDEQFEPRVEGDKLIGRGAYDMKGALAAMMCATHDIATQENVRVHFLCVSDEESEELGKRGTDLLIEEGYGGDFAITGEPTDLHIGVQSKGVIALRLKIVGRAAHGSTPWLGDNAVLKALDTFRAVESMPFARESTELFDRPSINLGRIVGGDAINKVPDMCVMDIDIRYLPGQDPKAIAAAVAALPGVEVEKVFERVPAHISRSDPFVVALGNAITATAGAEPSNVGRDGSSEATIFLGAGVPAVEYGPAGAGHHGPDEWVSLESLATYRRSLVEFVRAVSAGAVPASSTVRRIDSARSA